jgi:hypothetical protein
MKKNETISKMIESLDSHFIELYENHLDLQGITLEEMKFGKELIKELRVDLENPEMLQISATPEAIFCLAVKSFRRTKI